MKEQQIVEVMEKSEAKNFEKPDEVREFSKGRLELLKIGGVTVGRAKLEPGWHWSEAVGPVLQMDSCPAGHFMYFIAGTMKIHLEDGKEFECHAGDVCLIPPGHDSWVVGDEPVEVVDFQGMSAYSEAE